MRSLVRLVWALDVRHLVAHRTRLALSVLGIATGVALAVAVGALSSSVTGSLEGIARAAASEANLEIRPNGDAGLPPELLGRVRSVEGIEEAGAVVESYVQLRAADRKVRVLAMGLDQGILAMSPQALDTGGDVRVADPFGLIVADGVAGELGVRAGDRIEMTTPSGWRPVPVGAVLPPGTAERTRVVVSTVGTMQQHLGRGTSFDAIYAKAADPDAALPRVQRAIGQAARVGPIAFQSGQIQQLLAGANASFLVGTIVALFVGAFLVFNTMTMAAVERLREAALLRAVGAKRRQVFALFLAEGGVLGAAGSVLGVAGGLAMTSLLLGRRGGAVEEIYPVQITEVTIDARFLVAAAVAGVAAAVAAAFLPARRVARADPAPALGPAGTLEDPTRGPRRAATVLGIVAVVAGPAVAVPAVAGLGAGPVALAGFAVTLSGIALLIPTGVPALARALLTPLARLPRAPGQLRLSVGEVLRAPGRTSFTVGAVLLSLALVVGFSVAQSSFTRAFDVGFEDILSADLYVRSPTWRIFGSDVPLDESLANEIEDVPGVEASWPFRLMPATLEDRPLLVLAYDADKYARHSRLPAASKREATEQARVLRKPDTVLATPSLRSQLGYDVGDTIRLATPTGPRSVRIGGVLNDPSAINPEIVFDHEEFRRIWGVGGADNFAVVASDPASAPRVREAIEERFTRYDLQVGTRREYLELISGAVSSVQQLIGSVQLIAVIVAGLGLANTLLISTLERRRDLGVLRAIGMLRRQLRRMVAAEALLIGALGVLLAWGLGTLIGLGMYGFLQAQLGLGLPLVLPLAGYLGAAVLGLAAALVASLYPAQRAARVDVVDALAYE